MRFIQICLLFSSFFSFMEGVLPPPKKMEYQLTVLAIFKNEAPWLKEWIEYHRIVGVDHFLLYNNESGDNFKQVLKPYIDQNIVELLPWPSKPLEKKMNDWVNKVQIPCYNEGIRRMKGKTHWLAIIDCDEFIVPVNKKNINLLLKDFETKGGLVINWINYGNSGIWTLPKGNLLIENMIFRGPIQSAMNKWTKVIVQPKHVLEMTEPHSVLLKNGKKLCYSDYTEFSLPRRKIITSDIVINHYPTRTVKYCVEHKIPRKEMFYQRPLSEEEKEALINSFNEEEDMVRPIFKFIDPLKKRLFN